MRSTSGRTNDEVINLRSRRRREIEGLLTSFVETRRRDRTEFRVNRHHLFTRFHVEFRLHLDADQFGTELFRDEERHGGTAPEASSDVVARREDPSSDSEWDRFERFVDELVHRCVECVYAGDEGYRQWSTRWRTPSRRKDRLRRGERDSKGN